MSLKRMTIGSLMMSGATGFKLIAQFFIVPILARFLSPEDYGLVALAMPFILFSIIVARSGLGPSLLRDKECDAKSWDSSFWFTVGMGLLLTFSMILIAPLMAHFFASPGLSVILMALAPSIFLQAIAIIPLTRLRYEYRFGLITFVQIFSVSAGLGVAVLIALSGGGAWALVGQGLTMQGLQAILVLFLSRFRPSFSFSINDIKDHLAFGRSFVGYRFLDFAKDSTHSFLIGKVLGVATLGYFTLAFLFFNLPYRVVSDILQDVVYPQLARYRDDKYLLQQMLFLLTRILGMLLFPVMIMVAAAHEPVFTLILSDKWALSAWIFMIVAPVMALHTVMCLRTIFMLSQGKADENFRCSLELFILQISVFIAFIWLGIEWAMVGFSLALLAYQPRNIYILMRSLECRAISYLPVLTLPIAISAAGAAGYISLTHYWNSFSILGSTFLAAFICLTCMVCCVGLQWHQIKSEIKSVGGILAHKP